MELGSSTSGAEFGMDAGAPWRAEPIAALAPSASRDGLTSKHSVRAVPLATRLVGELDELHRSGYQTIG